MDIVLKTELKKSFRQYLEILQPMVGYTSKEADILALFMYHNYINQDIPERIRGEYLFSTNTRKTIREELDMSIGSFNNNMSSLKKTILKDNKLPKKLDVFPEQTKNGLILPLKFYFLVQDAKNSTENN
jgi:hypothetical protein